MALDGWQLVLLIVAFLAVLVVGGAGASAGAHRPWRRRREPDRPLVDETGPYEVPEDDAPTRSDD